MARVSGTTLTPNSIEYLENVFLMYPDETTFYFESGEYLLRSQLNIDKEGVRFIGLTQNPNDVIFKQETPDQNGINIRADNFVMNYITVKVEQGLGVCLSHSNANWTNIESCVFYGSDTNFTIYFAGPPHTEGQDTIDGYNNDQLDRFNVFDNNIIYTKWNGDSVSFSLQQFGSVRDNVIRGGKFAIYLVKDCIVSNNLIRDSSSQGIFLSLPSKNITITHNKIINTHGASISVKNQLEHGDYVSVDHNILIKENNISYCKFISIELNNTDYVKVRKNTIRETTSDAIYLLNSINTEIEDNLFVKQRRGVFVDQNCDNNLVKNNNFCSVYPSISEHGIVISDTASNTIIVDNTIKGVHTSVGIKDSGISSTLTNNLEVLTYTFQEELLMIN